MEEYDKVSMSRAKAQYRVGIHEMHAIKFPKKENGARVRTACW